LPTFFFFSFFRAPLTIPPDRRSLCKTSSPVRVYERGPSLSSLLSLSFLPFCFFSSMLRSFLAYWLFLSQLFFSFLLEFFFGFLNRFSFPFRTSTFFFEAFSFFPQLSLLHEDPSGSSSFTTSPFLVEDPLSREISEVSVIDSSKFF